MCAAWQPQSMKAIIRSKGAAPMVLFSFIKVGEPHKPWLLVWALAHFVERFSVHLKGGGPHCEP